MLKIEIIGYGAIAEYLCNSLADINASLAFVIARPGKQENARAALGVDIEVLERLGNARPDIIVDCAGHSALQEQGVEILNAGVPLITVSIGALADQALYNQLIDAAKAGGTKLHLSSGAIGG